MKKSEILENILVEKLVFGGKGFARLVSENENLNGRVVFITGNPIPGSRVNLRILKRKKDFIEAQILDVIEKSPLEKENPNNLYGMSGGWEWINIPYEDQLKIKTQQVQESLFHLKKLQENICVEPIQSSPVVYGYRNKIEFSFGKFISARFEKNEHFNVGFHKQGEFSKIEDIDGCPLIDEEQNSIYREIKNFTKESGLPVYDSMREEGFFRHLILRKTHFTGQMMIILGFNPKYFSDSHSLQIETKKIKDFFTNLAYKYPVITSIYFSHNDNKADIALGKMEHIYGSESIVEKIHELHFHISPKSFFQTNSSGAQKLYSMVLDYAHKEKLKDQTVLDLYGGTGTIGMIFAQAGAKSVRSVEMVVSASENGKNNALQNGLQNIDFVCAKVEDFLAEYLGNDCTADLLVIDPPRTGMHPNALPNILKFQTQQIIYVSCNPATLARDLHFILSNSDYRIEKVGMMDMFPHTHHIEVIVSLIKK